MYSDLAREQMIKLTRSDRKSYLEKSNLLAVTCTIIQKAYMLSGDLSDVTHTAFIAKSVLK